jgi:FAR1 DNA-binding domain
MDGDDPYIGFKEFSNLNYCLDESDEIDIVLEDEEDKIEGECEGEGENIEESEKENVVVEDLRPCIGMEFKTVDEAFNFYNAYGGHAGFSVRRNTFTKSKKGVSSFRFVCSKEGFSKKQLAEQKSLGSSTYQKTPEREYESTRTGCKAYLRIKLLKSGVWQISIFEDEHNHALILSPSKNRNLRSQKQMQAEDKELILDLNAQNVGTSQIMEYMAVEY